MKYCGYCGKEINDNSNFCPYCGGKIERNESNDISYLYDDTRYEYQEENINYIKQTSSTNTFAILGFIFSFFSPILGWIFGSIGKRKALECGSGYGLAKAATIIATVTFILNIILVALEIYFYL